MDDRLSTQPADLICNLSSSAIALQTKAKLGFLLLAQFVGMWRSRWQERARRVYAISVG
ncbi:MAG: hypothetical protein ACFB0E_02895 [Leptolyngbyaceae cyanobacterium]